MDNYRDALKVLEKWVSCGEYEERGCDYMCDTCEFDGSAEELDKAIKFIVSYNKKEIEE